MISDATSLGGTRRLGTSPNASGRVSKARRAPPQGVRAICGGLSDDLRNPANSHAGSALAPMPRQTAPCPASPLAVHRCSVKTDLPFPRHLDEPPTILLWRLDDLMPAVAGLIIGMLAAHPWIFAAIGFAAGYGYRRYRDSRPDGYMLHLLYWHGVVPLKARTIPNPFARHFAP